MSADNWAVCPACLHKEQTRIAELREQVTAAYGTLPVEEFDALRAESEKPIDEGALTTFREDYEFYGAEEGVIVASYKGHCQKCGVGIDFTEEHGFWSPHA